ncbi:Deuterolysin metalloprotease family-domain-containing protein [Aspergillus coremiiformis]|uniref:Deuterolysin metalloprotease family-domain-containing protein n=1 Tax=Aspergillus coremiiformis TaxID=138285 RepID=A0A5N6Z3K3_9EURO|nr:Deuterolysin metalloprotease family-domain-containing protein [Aspergillus coremiiformis]
MPFIPASSLRLPMEDEFDIAATSDLSSGGTITINSNGVVPNVTGYIPFSSNGLFIDVDPDASTVPKTVSFSTVVPRRSTAPVGNSGPFRQLSTAYLSCRRDRHPGGNEATFEYFKLTSSTTRETVIARLNAIAEQAASTSSTYYCIMDTAHSTSWRAPFRF